MGYIKEAKMSIENEIDDLFVLKNGMNQLNTKSLKASKKFDQRINFVKNRLIKLKVINEEAEFGENAIVS